MNIIRRAAAVGAGLLLAIIPLMASAAGPRFPSAGIVRGNYYVDTEFYVCVYDLHFVGRIQAGTKAYTLLTSNARMTHRCIDFTVGSPEEVPLTLNLRGRTPQRRFTWNCFGSVDLYRNVGSMTAEPLTCQTEGFPGTFPMNLTIDRTSHVGVSGITPDGPVAGFYVLTEDPLP